MNTVIASICIAHTGKSNIALLYRNMHWLTLSLLTRYACNFQSLCVSVCVCVHAHGVTQDPVLNSVSCLRFSVAQCF